MVCGRMGGPEVEQVVLPATPGGSPATQKRQVNVALARNNDLPYGFWRPPILSRTLRHIAPPEGLVRPALVDKDDHSAV